MILKLGTFFMNSSSILHTYILLKFCYFFLYLHVYTADNSNYNTSIARSAAQNFTTINACAMSLYFTSKYDQN